ncbi:hypothetical protein [Algoriphagus boritolerans]|uniref:hypothetical protein n=1 Tax=Algoriphagus boritolerans TaxID=308111 RepID=UPI002FCDE943
MSDAYGFLAPIYQPLSRLVFGRDLIYANQAFLEGNTGKKDIDHWWRRWGGLPAFWEEFGGGVLGFVAQDDSIGHQ